MRDVFPTVWLALSLILVLGQAHAAPPSGLERLVEGVAARVEPVRAGSTLAVCVHGPPRLAEMLAARLVTRLGGRSCPSSNDKFERLVDLTVTMTRDTARVSGEVRAPANALWGVTEPRVLATVFAESAFDDELRAMQVVAPPTVTPPIQPAVRPLPPGLRSRMLSLPDLDVLALALADVNGDGSAELLLLTPTELVVARIEPTRVVELRRLALPPGMSPSLSRVETGTLAVRGNEVFAHASGLRDGLHWRIQASKGEPAELLERWRGFAFPGLEKCEQMQGTDLFQCAGLADKVWTAQLVTLAVGRITVVSGPGMASVTGVGGAPELVAGTQLAAGTLRHGDVVAFSDGKLRGEPDAITVRALTSGLPVVGRVERLFGVRGLGFGVVDGVPVLAAVARDAVTKKSELWLVD